MLRPGALDEFETERLRAERKRTRSVVRGELFRIRFSFGDPDAALNRWYPRLRWCFTPAFVVLSIALFLAYGVHARTAPYPLLRLGLLRIRPHLHIAFLRCAPDGRVCSVQF